MSPPSGGRHNSYTILTYNETCLARPPLVLRKSGISRHVQFAWNPMAGRSFHKLENGLSRQGGLSRGGRSRQVSLYCSYPSQEDSLALMLSSVQQDC